MALVLCTRYFWENLLNMETFMVMNTSATIIKSVSTKIADNLLRDDGIVVVRLREGAEVDVDGLKENFGVTFQMTEGRKSPVLIDSRTLFTTTLEARTYSAAHAKNFRVAQAILIDSLAMRIMANFYVNFNKPGVPTKLFTSFDEAVKWLMSVTSR